MLVMRVMRLRNHHQSLRQSSNAYIDTEIVPPAFTIVASRLVQRYYIIRNTLPFLELGLENEITCLCVVEMAFYIYL